MSTIPTVGSSVTVVLKLRDYYYCRTSDWKYMTYTGTVLQSQKWDSPTTFRMTGDETHPERVIWMIDVDKLTVNGQEASTKPDEQVKTVVVKGSKGDEYVVRISPKGNQCTCPAFVFRKMQTCKHIKGVIEHL